MDWASLFSTVLNAYSSHEQGASRDRAATFEAEQLEQRAGQYRASGQRAAMEERRRAALAGSALQARAGGGGSDPTVVKLAADIAGEGEYRALAALYGAEERAVGDEMSAAGRRYTGRDARRAGNIGAGAALLEGGTSMYGLYGRGGPKRWRGIGDKGDELRYSDKY
jgi:hypothetical protein